MDKVIRRIVPTSEYRHYLLGFGYEPYYVSKIQFDDRSDNIIVTLILNDGKQKI